MDFCKEESWRGRKKRMHKRISGKTRPWNVWSTAWPLREGWRDQRHALPKYRIRFENKDDERDFDFSLNVFPIRSEGGKTTVFWTLFFGISLHTSKINTRNHFTCSSEDGTSRLSDEWSVSLLALCLILPTRRSSAQKVREIGSRKNSGCDAMHALSAVLPIPKDRGFKRREISKNI